MIAVNAITKKFKLYHSPADRLREIIFRHKYHKDFVALDSVSFTIDDGMTLGIIGQNGAGKSTLLKILSGIVIPDSGSIRLGGRVTGLLELGTGFNFEMTGLDNISMNGTLLGMSRSEIEAKKETIVHFSELGEFIDEPIKTYSSGMVMRLAFSIAIHADPSCFLVDEALSVGDAYFQQKCMRKFQEFRQEGGSIIFVSHDLNAIKALCDTAIMLDHGRIVEQGDPKDVTDLYQNVMLKKMHQGDLPVHVQVKNGLNSPAEMRSGIATGEVELVSFRICNEHGEEISSVESEHPISIQYSVRCRKDLEEPHYGLMIRNDLGVSIFETNTYCMHLKQDRLLRGQTAEIHWTLDFPLYPGTYSFSVGVANKGIEPVYFSEYLLIMHDIGALKVMKNSQSITYFGVFNIRPNVSVQIKDTGS